MESMANKYKDMLAILQYNFNNLYAHYVNLAIKMEEKDESLALMEWRPSWAGSRGDKVQLKLCEAREKQAKSTLSLELNN